MKRAFIFIAAVAMLLIDASPLWTQGEPISLQEIWRREENGMTYSKHYKVGRLVIMTKQENSRFHAYLIDLRTGETIYKTNPDTDAGSILCNYFGDRFYVRDKSSKQLKEYDVKTKEFIRDVTLIAGANDSSSGSFISSNHSLVFWNSNTGEKLDSFKIPGTPNTPLYQLLSNTWEFSSDSRYFFFGLYDIWDQSTRYYYIYDRQNREIIWQKTLYEHESLRYQFFNTSNKIAFAEEVQLPEDDKVYSYIRIFDPDTRTIVKDIKLSEYPCSGFALGMDDKRLVYQLFDPEVYNVNHIYNNEKNIFEAFRFKVPGSLTLIDTNVIYSYIGYGLAAYKFDSTVFIEENGGQEETSIYPNPTTQNATIELKSIDIGKSWILSDVSGGLIRQGKIEAESSLNIDLAEFARGTYYITIIGANEQRTYKLIKL